MELLMYGLTVVAAASAAAVCYPFVSRFSLRTAGAVGQYQQVRVDKAAKALDDIFMEVKPRWLTLAYGVGPLAGGLALLFLFKSLILACAGAIAGILLPDLWVRQTRAIRRRQFRNQLVDALLILSSSLRAGLSLTQAFEQLEAEMPPPASQEFGLSNKAYRLGQPFEEALNRLRQRNPCEEIDVITTALLVTRESGGDATKIIGQLVTTVRERKKLNDKVMTLTLQGRLQAYIMSVLPIAFALFARTFNPTYFELLMDDPAGKGILALAMALWVVGMALLFRMSRVEA